MNAVCPRDITADHFYWREFFATLAASLELLKLLNLSGEFQFASGQGRTLKPAGPRAQVFPPPAMRGPMGYCGLLHPSSARDGIETHNSLLHKHLDDQIPTSPKLYYKPSA